MKRSEAIEHEINIRRLLNELRATVSLALVVFTLYFADGFFALMGLLLISSIFVALVFSEGQRIRKLVVRKHEAEDAEIEECKQIHAMIELGWQGDQKGSAHD